MFIDLGKQPYRFIRRIYHALIGIGVGFIVMALFGQFGLLEEKMTCSGSWCEKWWQFPSMFLIGFCSLFIGVILYRWVHKRELILRMKEKL